MPIGSRIFHGRPRLWAMTMNSHSIIDTHHSHILPTTTMMLSSRLLTRQTRLLRLSTRRLIATSRQSTPNSHRFLFAAAAAVTASTAAVLTLQNAPHVAQCSAPLGSEPVMLSPKTEPATGILFPRLCNGMTLAGCGVRVKWGFVKVRLYIACRAKYDAILLQSSTI